MKNKLFLTVILSTLLIGGIIYAANTFPVSLNDWEEGDLIEEGWANALEDKIGIDDSNVTTSLDYLVKTHSQPTRLTVSATSTLATTTITYLGVGTTTPNNLIQVKDLINFDNNNFGTFLGYQAGISNTSGNFLTAIGYQAGMSNTSGNFNTAIGYQALNSNTTSTYNTAVGYVALKKNTSGLANDAFGSKSLYSNTTGHRNVAIGVNSMTTNTTGFQNTAVGHDVMYDNTTGVANVAFGTSALHDNITGNFNTALGYLALTSSTSTSKNTAIGNSALSNFLTGTYNTVIGDNSGQLLQSGNNNVFLGYYVARGIAALGVYTNADNNTIIGYEAGYNATSSWSGNVFLGHQAGYYETGSNKLYIDNSSTTNPLIYGEFDNDLITINGDLTVTGTTTQATTTISKLTLTTDLDIGDDTNLAAGRSLTLTGDSVAADAELYTDTKCLWFEDPTAADDFKSNWRSSIAITFTKIWAESDQTVTFNLQEDDGSPGNILNSSLAPAAGTASSTSFADASFAADSRLDLVVDSVADTPTWVSICWTYTKDD